MSLQKLTLTYPSLRRAVADYLASERAYVAAEAAELSAGLPFRSEEAEF